MGSVKEFEQMIELLCDGNRPLYEGRSRWSTNVLTVIRLWINEQGKRHG